MTNRYTLYVIIYLKICICFSLFLASYNLQAQNKYDQNTTILLADSTDEHFGSYWGADKDTSIIGTYIAGRPLSGIGLILDSSSKYFKKYHCDICPEYSMRGKYSVHGDTIFLDRLAINEDTLPDGEASYWKFYDILDTFVTDTIYRIYINDNIFLHHSSPSEGQLMLWELVMTLKSEYIKMDNLPYRKVCFHF